MENRNENGFMGVQKQNYCNKLISMELASFVSKVYILINSVELIHRCKYVHRKSKVHFQLRTSCWEFGYFEFISMLG